jgi:hypothetical protein
MLDDMMCDNDAITNFIDMMESSRMDTGIDISGRSLAGILEL